MGLKDSIQTLARFTAIHKVTPQEYAENLFYTIATIESVDSDGVDCVIASLPEHARSTLIDHIDVILADDFRFHDLSYGGPGPLLEERERVRLLYQNRVKTFASLLRDRFNTSPNPAETFDDSNL